MNNTDKYLIMLNVNRLCTALFDELFRCQQGHISTNPSLPLLLLGLSDNYIRRAAGTTFYKNEDYYAYINTSIEALGYTKENVPKCHLYMYTMVLRDLFNADETLLKTDFDLKRFGPLPTTQEIKNFLGLKFYKLATTYRTAIDNESIKPENVKDFLKTELDKALDPNEYLGV